MADQAGIKAGEIIFAWGKSKKRLISYADLRRAIRRAKYGIDVPLIIKTSNGESRTVTIVFSKKP